MQITMNRSSKKKIGEIVITHKDEKIVFIGSGQIRLERVIRDKDDVESNLFDCLNDYVGAVLSESEQDRIFSLYKEAHTIIESGDFKDYYEELVGIKRIVGSVLEVINPRKYEDFIQYSDYLKIPAGLSEAARKGDYPIETTITDEDYVGLVKFTFLVRTIYPIVFGLCGRFDAIMGTTAELISGYLIKDNPVITNTPGWRKLNTYIDFSFNKRGIPSLPEEVKSMENFTDQVLFSAIFSRLCCSVIPETEKDKNLATAINATVKSFEGGRSNFKPKRTSMGDDDKRSIYDKYMISESVRVSDQVVQGEFFSFGLFDEEGKEKLRDRFKYQCKALGIKNEELVGLVYDNLPRNWEFELHDHIHKLLQIIYSGKVSPFIFEACDYTQLMASIALGQVWLSEQGFLFLPSVLGAIDNPKGARQLPDSLKLSNDDKEYLASICEVQSRNSEGRSYNEAIVAATEFLDGFGNGTWQSNLEYGVLSDDAEVYKRVREGSMFEIEIETGIKDEFINLIKLNN